jgi:type I restriction enzyme S subunit
MECALRRYCKVFAGATPSRARPDYWDQGTIPWLSSGDVNKRRIREASQFITDAGFEASSTKWIRPGSVVVALAGQGRTKGMAATVEFAATCNQSMAVAEPDPARCDYRYLAYYLESQYLNLRALVGDDLRDGLNLEHIKALRTPHPPMDEQSAIVRYLDHIDGRVRGYVAAKRKLIERLNEQKQATSEDGVTRGLDDNVRFKPSGVQWLGTVPDHWLVQPAKYFFREVDERSVTGAEELLSVSHLTGVTPRSQKNVTMFMASSYEGHKVCKPGDLVINTMWAWAGALGIARSGGIVSPSYAVYRPIDGSPLLPEYADLLLHTRPYVSEYTLSSTGIRSSRLRLYPDKFLRINLVCPPRDEQEAIILRTRAKVAIAERAILAAQGEIDLVREYRNRLVADAVTGRFDVREAVRQLPAAAEVSESLVDTVDEVADDIDVQPDEADV